MNISNFKPVTLPADWTLIERSKVAILGFNDATKEWCAWSVDGNGDGVAHGWYAFDVVYARHCYTAKNLGRYPLHYMEEIGYLKEEPEPQSTVTFDTMIHDIYDDIDIQIFNDLCDHLQDFQSLDRNGDFMDGAKEVLTKEITMSELLTYLRKCVEDWRLDVTDVNGNIDDDSKFTYDFLDKVTTDLLIRHEDSIWY